MTWWKWSPYNAVSTGSKTGSSSVEASVTAVLDLPGVVEHVPGHPAQHIPRRPLPILAPTEGVRDHCALLLPVCARGHPCTRLRGVAPLCLHDVPTHVVTVAAAAARPLAQTGRRLRCYRVEMPPDLREQMQLPVELCVIERLQIPLGRDRGRTEVGCRVTRDPTDDRRGHRGQRRPDSGGVAVGVREQLLDGEFVTFGT